MNKLKRVIAKSLIVAQLTLYPLLAYSSEPNWYALGLQAEVSGNYSVAIERYHASASRGLSDAKFALGKLYRDVYGDSAKSLKWFKDAANQGNVFAQYELGKLYMEGGAAVTADAQAAKKWLSLAANNGRIGGAAFAMFGLEEQPEEKLKWLRRAAEWGDIDAMLRLSEAHEKGEFGLQESMRDAQRWNRRAEQSQEYEY